MSDEEDKPPAPPVRLTSNRYMCLSYFYILPFPNVILLCIIRSFLLDID